MTKRITIDQALDSGIVTGIFLGFSRPQPCKDLNFAMLSINMSRSDESFRALEALGLDWRTCKDEEEYDEPVYDPRYICGVAKESLYDAVELSCFEWQEGTFVVGLDRFIASEKPFRYESSIPAIVRLQEATGSKSGTQRVLLAPARPSYEYLGDEDNEEEVESEFMDLDVPISDADGLVVANLWKLWRDNFEYVSSAEHGESKFKLMVRPTSSSLISKLEAYSDSPDNLIWSYDWDFDSFSDLNKAWNARPFFVFKDD